MPSYQARGEGYGRFARSFYERGVEHKPKNRHDALTLLYDIGFLYVSLRVIGYSEETTDP